MDFSPMYVLYNCEESSSERSPSKNVSGNDRIRLTLGYSRPIRNSHFTMTIKKNGTTIVAKVRYGNGTVPPIDL